MHGEAGASPRRSILSRSQLTASVSLLLTALVHPVAAAEREWRTGEEWTKGLGGEYVKMEPGAFGEDAEFINRFLTEEVEKATPPPYPHSSPYSREKNVHVGRFDLNGDGTDELFITVNHSYFCGSIGCPYHVFEMRGGAWHYIGGGRSTVFATDEWVCGYRSLLGTEGIYRWTGEGYAFAYCFPDEVECREEAVYYGESELLDPDNGLIPPGACPGERPARP